MRASLGLAVLCAAIENAAGASFLFAPKLNAQPRLVLIGGCTGTGKSTFGMEIALSQGILKCVSTDTVREVTRAFDRHTPALHRSSYSGDMEPVQGWKEASGMLDEGINALVDDAIKRGVSLVLEGVHLIPSNNLLNKWEQAGEITGKGESKKMQAFERIRTIQDEMIRLAIEHDWVIVEQKLELDPVDVVAELLLRK
ncbi:hypothetical protein T492DRAFT_1030364 [Pavlovales sp. CCMP2436]|nr:hypothetical protein T492DRAFT_1030364 [Pavlovales sp. CCMP2436]